MPDTPTAAVGCGTCGHVCAAKSLPDACFRCGARFDQGAHHALLVAEVSVSLDGFGVQTRVELHGEWPQGEADSMRRAMISLVE